MKITDLTHDEKLTLIGLEKTIIQADRTFSSEEAAELKKLAKAMGEEQFKALVDEAKQAFKSLDAIKEQAKKVERPEARQLIYTLLYEMAVPDGLADNEKRVLRWLAKTWQIEGKQV